MAIILVATRPRGSLGDLEVSAVSLGSWYHVYFSMSLHVWCFLLMCLSDPWLPGLICPCWLTRSFLWVSCQRRCCSGTVLALSVYFTSTPRVLPHPHSPPTTSTSLSTLQSSSISTYPSNTSPPCTAPPFAFCKVFDFCGRGRAVAVLRRSRWLGTGIYFSNSHPISP